MEGQQDQGNHGQQIIDEFWFYCQRRKERPPDGIVERRLPPLREVRKHFPPESSQENQTALGTAGAALPDAWRYRGGVGLTGPGVHSPWRAEIGSICSFYLHGAARTAVCMHGCLHVWLSARMAVCTYGCLHVWLSVCMAVCTSGCLYVWLSAHLAVCTSGCLHVWLSVCMAVCTSGCLHIWLSVCMAVCTSGCLHIWLSVCMAVCTSGCLHVWLSARLAV